LRKGWIVGKRVKQERLDTAVGVRGLDRWGVKKKRIQSRGVNVAGRIKKKRELLPGVDCGISGNW